EACGVDLETDRRWEQVWDRLAVQAQNRDMSAKDPQLEIEDLRRQLAAARAQVSDTTTALHADNMARSQLKSRHEAWPTIDRWPQSTEGGGHEFGQATIGRTNSPGPPNPETIKISRSRSNRLLIDVVRVTYSITSENWKASILACLVQAIATTD